VARKQKQNKSQNKESDSQYVLKLIMYLIVGSFWLKVTTAGGLQIPLPIGFILGLFFASHERFRIDRKIEYAVLLVAMLVGFWLPIGLFIST
jgi:ABC-type dipeptide/oligopeptide/nickel transport system permease component